MSCRYYITLLTLLAILTVPAVTADSPAEGELAQINPEFEEWIKNPETENTEIISPSSSGEELIRSTGYIPSPMQFSHLNPDSGKKTILRSVPLPTSYDLREEGRITPPKNQGHCGSCWVFATFGSMESYLMPGEILDFSENNLKNTHGFDTSPCNGGTGLMSAAYLARWSGPVSEDADPYNISSEISPEKLPVVKHTQDIDFISPRNDPDDNELFKKAIMNKGAVYSSLRFESDSYNPESSAYYYSGTDNGNHAITLVGWDDDFDGNLFSSAPAGDGAFIAKNSWGREWGDKGFFYISYYDTNLGYSENKLFTAENTKNYDNIYQYDPLGLVGLWGYNSTYGWFANRFTSENEEELIAVSFYADQYNSPYHLEIRSAMDSPVIAEQNGTLPTAGYHTITLDNAVHLSPDKDFYILVNLTTPGYNYPIPMEYPYSNYSGRATAETGQSYISPDGENWTDATLLVDNANVCLKAFTTEERAPEAAFAANKTTGREPFTVRFTDLTAYSPDSWRWEFDDGTATSVDENPVHTFTSKGEYTVRLTAANAHGSSPAEHVDYIKVTSETAHVPEDYLTIQDAVDAALPGDTIIVESGTYNERVSVTKPLNITGRGMPVIDAGGRTNAVTVNAAGTTIDGFVVKGSGEEVYDAGILVCADNTTLSNITATGNGGCGIYIKSANNISISAINASSNDSDGIKLLNSSNAVLSGINTPDNQYKGVYLAGCSEILVNECNSAVNGENGIKIYDSKNITLNGVETNSNECGIEVDSSSGISITNSTADYNLCCLALLKNARNMHISGFSASNNYGSFYLRGANGICISNATLINTSSDAIYARGSDSCEISDSLIINSSRCGLRIKNCEGLSIRNNTISANGKTGIDLYNTENSVLTKNRMLNNKYGFSCRNSGKGRLPGNSIGQLPGNSIDTTNTVDGKPIIYLEGKSGITIDKADDPATVYCIECSDITIRNLELYDNYYGICLINTTGSHVMNNEMHNLSSAVFMELCSDTAVDSNNLSYNRYGIDLRAADHITLHNNTANGNGYGIRADEASNLTITGNSVELNVFRGIHLQDCAGITMQDNVMENNCFNFFYLNEDKNPGNIIDTTNTVNGKPIIYLESVDNKTIDENSNAGCVICTGCSGINITGIKFESNGYAVYLTESTNCSISETDVKDTDLGVLLYGVDNSSIQRCNFSGNGYAVIGRHSTNLSISDNRISGNLSALYNNIGIYLIISDNLDISGNYVAGTRTGFIIMYSDNSTITNNSATNCGTPEKERYCRGFSLYRLSNGSILDNNASSNSWGFCMYSNNNCTVSRNIILNNYFCAFDMIDSHNSLISENQADGGNRLGLLMMGSTNNRVKWNNFSGSDTPVNTQANRNNNIWQNNFFKTPSNEQFFEPGSFCMPTGEDILTEPNSFLLSAGTEENNLSLYGLSCLGIDNGTTSDLFRTGIAAGTPPFELQSYGSFGIDCWNSPEKLRFRYDGKAVDNYTGNYWNTYNGTDTNNDGIGDSSFSIDEHITDFYPLMEPCEIYRKPFAEFTAAPRHSTSAPLNVTFNSTALRASEWHWNFGDGETSTEEHPVHTYDRMGEYTVSLTAANDFGTDIGTAEDYIVIRESTGNSGGNGHRASVGVASGIHAGDTVSMPMSKTVVYMIGLKAREDISEIMLETEDFASLPSGIDAPLSPVFRYIEVNLFKAAETDIAGAFLEFRVPPAWLNETGLAPEDIVLMRYHNGEWNSLPTEYTGNSGGSAHFKADSPGFSYFAISTDSEAHPVEQPEVKITPTTTELVALSNTTEETPKPAEPTATPVIYAPALALPAYLLFRRLHRG